MTDKKKSTKGNMGPVRPWTLPGLSAFFYQKSNLAIAGLMTVFFGGYLSLVLTAKGTGFEVADGSVKSLGTSFAFDQADILAFLGERTDEMINSYISFNQVWDTLFGVIYGLMYVAWVSLLFRPFSKRARLLNLIPLAQVLFDWFENYALASLCNQYLSDGEISATLAQFASVSSMIKWAFSALVYAVILVGIILRISRARGRSR